MPSKSPRKQRRALRDMPLHKRQKVMAAHLSDDLLEKYKRRSMPVRVGDTVEVVRGDYSGISGKVLEVDRDDYTIHIDSVTVRQARGTEMPRPVHPSNVRITKLNLQDPVRRERLAAKGVEVEVPEPEPEEEPEEAPEADAETDVERPVKGPAAPPEPEEPEEPEAPEPETSDTPDAQAEEAPERPEGAEAPATPDLPTEPEAEAPASAGGEEE